MTRKEFEAKLKTIPTTKPDELDLEMIRVAENENDGTTVALEDLKRSLEDYSGKLVLRLPRSLHKQLTEAAKIEGVSLNQYMLYKLAR